MEWSREAVAFWVGILADVATAGAAVGAVFVAALGLQTWREQLRGSTESDLAERLLRAVIAVRDSFADARHRRILPEEIQAAYARPDAPKETDDAHLAFEASDALIARHAEVRERLASLDALSVEAEARWGSDIRLRCSRLREPFTAVELAVAPYLVGLAMFEATGKESFRDSRAERIVFAVEGEEDTVGADMEAAVGLISESLRPKLISEPLLVERGRPSDPQLER